VDIRCNRLRPPSCPSSYCSFVPDTTTGRHVWVTTDLLEIHESFEIYFEAKQDDPAHTSAIFALPRWYRKKSWHKFLKGMVRVHEMSAADLTCPGAECSPPWGYEFWYDAPTQLMSCSTLSDGEPLSMSFVGGVNNTRARVLLDSGATHNFVRNFCDEAQSLRS
jgi:hypothetical protein